MNTFIIAVFKNRTYTYGFYNALANSGIKCYIVNTPKQNFVSCGISVKFPYKDLAKANEKLSPFRSNFVGYLKSTT